ncbi:MAG: PEP-utilizing enzyme, partial [Calditrichota bacterium]
TIYPGAVSGPIFHYKAGLPLDQIPGGVVLVTPHPFPGLGLALSRICALITETGGLSGHLATLAREYHLPSVAGMARASSLKSEQLITLDALARVVYDGERTEIIQARQTDPAIFEDVPLYKLLNQLLEKIAPLNLVHPTQADFVPESCRTLHDIIRYCHQLSMLEMFHNAERTIRNPFPVWTLKTVIPLKVKLIILDDYPQIAKRNWINEDDIPSAPLKAFWDGLRQEGWPSPGVLTDQRIPSIAASNASAPDSFFEESSYGVLSSDFMILSLRLGYHFSSIEALGGEDPSQNYIRYQHKGGGAALERRILRVTLIMDILSRLGFENASQGDFLDARIAYISAERVREALKLLGRLTMKTKQLDMALSNPAITKWYARDIMRSLGLNPEGNDV